MLTSRFAMHIAVGALLTLPLWSLARAEQTAAAAPPRRGEGPGHRGGQFPDLVQPDGAEDVLPCRASR